ncbi:hypothetical protein D8S78_00455 [Natrialba swarupiae]|nr:hypothetical protein [Natrialba swarupiae]
MRREDARFDGRTTGCSREADRHRDRPAVVRFMPRRHKGLYEQTEQVHRGDLRRPHGDVDDRDARDASLQPGPRSSAYSATLTSVLSSPH